jgi:hypothetical protein
MILGSLHGGSLFYRTEERTSGELLEAVGEGPHLWVNLCQWAEPE